MKIVLRIITIVVGVAVILTAIGLVRLAWLGALGVFVRRKAPLAPIFGAVAVNAAVLCLLLSSPARRRVS